MNRKTLIGGSAALLVLLIAGGLWYLNRPAAEEASIGNALEALDSTENTGDPTDEPVVLTDVTGEWAVNTEIGEFNFADATSTFAGFRVDEELTNVGQTEAVGRTPAVGGGLVIDGTTLQNAQIIVDFEFIESDVPRRDNAMRRALGVAENPEGTFTLTEPVDFGEIPTEGQTIAFTATGDLTVNGLTNPASFEMEARVAEGNILVVGTTPVVFADFGITAPQAGPVVAIDDNGTIEVQLWFSPV